VVLIWFGGFFAIFFELRFAQPFALVEFTQSILLSSQLLVHPAQQIAHVGILEMAAGSKTRQRIVSEQPTACCRLPAFLFCRHYDEGGVVLELTAAEIGERNHHALLERLGAEMPIVLQQLDQSFLAILLAV